MKAVLIPNQVIPPCPVASECQIIKRSIMNIYICFPLVGV